MKGILSLSLLLLTAFVFAQTVQNVPYYNDFNAYATEAAFTAEWKYENNPPDAGAGVWLFDYTAYFGYDTSNCPLYFTASDSNGDDWLFSPGFNLTAGTNYTLSFQLAGAFEGYTEKMKVYTGTEDTSSAMTQLIQDYTAISTATFSLSSINFSVPSDGVYYLGFLAYSDAGNFGIILDNFGLNVASGISEVSNLPSAVYPNPTSNFTTIAAPEGSLYQIFNSSGALTSKGICTSNQTKIDVSDYTPGIYTIQLRNNEKTSVLRFTTF